MIRMKVECIECPQCTVIQLANIEFRDGEPWPRYVHQCYECDYWITESEWNRVTK